MVSTTWSSQMTLNVINRKKVTVVFTACGVLFLFLAYSIISDRYVQRQKKLTIGRIWCNVSYYRNFLSDEVLTSTGDEQVAMDPSGELDAKRKYEIKRVKVFDLNKLQASDEMKVLNLPKTKENMTIITSYMELGRLDRLGEPNRGLKVYSRWASVFEYIVNPVVVYTENDDFARFMAKYRQKMKSKTVIFKVERRDLWGFKFYKKMCSIFQQPGYPVLQAVTERPDYDSTMHSKQEFVIDAVRRNLFNTSYFAWLDLGLFREIISETKYFRLNPPLNFDDNKIGFSRVHDFPFSVDPTGIFHSPERWISGSMYIGKRESLLKFSNLYKRSVKYFLSQNLASADEQVIYAAYTVFGRRIFKPDVEIQVFLTPDSSINPFHYLGYLCRTFVSGIE